MPVILIIIGVIAALGLGGFMWTNHKEEEIVTPPVVTTTVTETPTPTEPDPTISQTEPTTEPAPTTETPVTPPTTPTPTPVIPTPTPVTTPVPKTVYKNGTYTVGVSYKAPDRMDHPVTVKLTIADDIVTASDVTFGSEAREATAEFQGRFAASYKSQVVGKSLSSIKLSRVGGASLTTGAWNAAQAQIVAQAQS